MSSPAGHREAGGSRLAQNPSREIHFGRTCDSSFVILPLAKSENNRLGDTPGELGSAPPGTVARTIATPPTRRPADDPGFPKAEGQGSMFPLAPTRRKTESPGPFTHTVPRFGSRRYPIGVRCPKASTE